MEIIADLFKYWFKYERYKESKYVNHIMYLKVVEKTWGFGKMGY